MTVVGEAVVLIRGDSTNFTKQLLTDVDKAANTAGKNASKTFSLGWAAAGIAVAGGIAVAVKSAAEFNSSMELLHTQAGASQAEVDGLKSKVLDLAGVVGQNPNSLAEALYHVESVGYRANDALSILKVGAEEASISHSNLDDTLYSLTSTMKTYGDTGIVGATKDMALLNAIVGEGDMRFQDLNNAIQTGILSTAQTFGVDIRSVGAALDFLTDRGEKADVSSTRLSMGITLMAAPASKAVGILSALGVSQQDIKTSSDAMTSALSASGVTQTQLAADLRKPDGIFVALSDLKDHMTAAGISATQQGTIIASVFGGARTGKAIMALYENLDGIQLKYDQIGEAASKFGEDWSATQKTMTQRWHDLVAEIDADGIRLGNALMPVASGGLTALGDLAHGLESTAGLIARNHTLVIDLIGAWAGFRIVTALIGAAETGLTLLAVRALEVRESIAAMATTEELANFGALATTGQRVVGAVTGIGSSLLATVGPLAVAAGGTLFLANAVTSWFSGMAAAHKEIQSLNAEVAKAPSSTQSYTGAIGQLSSQIDKLNASVGGGDAWHLFLGTFTGNTYKYDASISSLTSELNKLIDAQQQVGARTELLADSMGGSNVGKVLSYRDVIQDMAGKGLIDLSDSLGVNTLKVKEYEAGVLHATPSQAALNQMLKDEANSATTAAQAATDLQNAINALGVANQNLLGTQLDVNKDILTLGQNIDANSRSLDQNSLAGIQNNQAILTTTGAIEQHVKALTAQHASQSQVNAYVFQSSVALEQQLVHLGFNKGAVDKLIQSLLEMPPAKATQVTVPGAAAADGIVRNLNADLDNIPDHRTVTLEAVDHASSTLSAIRNMIANINPNIPLTVTGYANLSKLTGISSADGNIFTAYAAGGENHVAQIAPAGAMRLWAEPETGGEAYIPLASSKRTRSVGIWQETGRALGVYAGSGFSGSYNGTLKPAGVRQAPPDDQMLDALKAIQSEIRNARPVTQNVSYSGIDPAIALRDANRELAWAMRGN